MKVKRTGWVSRTFSCTSWLTNRRASAKKLKHDLYASPLILAYWEINFLNLPFFSPFFFLKHETSRNREKNVFFFGLSLQMKDDRESSLSKRLFVSFMKWDWLACNWKLIWVLRLISGSSVERCEKTGQDDSSAAQIIYVSYDLHFIALTTNFARWNVRKAAD